LKIRIFIFVLCVVLTHLAQATHLIGGSMSYQYLGQNSRGNFNYKITLSIYRDCQQSEVPFDPSIKIGVYFNNTNRTRHKTTSIKLISKRFVNPPGNTQCLFKPNVCIEEGFYEGIIEVDPSTVGYHLTFVRCCRNIQNNLFTGGSGSPDQGQTYYCFIPPTDVKNSSPVFKGVPSPYMCVNDTTSFLNTATDPDGDSMVYYFVKPFQGGSQTGAGAEPDPPPTLRLPIATVVYNSGYNESQPFGATGYSKIDRFNGLTDYFTRITGNFVVAIEVAEYRNGVLLSVVRLDLQIIFINCPPNQKPTINSDKGKSFIIEAGSKLCFNVISTDANNDNLQLTPVGDIFTGANGWKGPRATLSAKTGKGSITSEFCWQTSCDQANARPYQFAVKVDDDGCPGKFNAVNFTILVTPFISKALITGPNSLCQNAQGKYTATNLAVLSSLEWSVTNGIIVSGQGTPNVTIKWNGTVSGKLRLRETSQYGCFGDWKEIDITINPSPPLPILSGIDTVCLNSANVPYNVTNYTVGLNITWQIKSGNITINNNQNITSNWPVLGDQIIKVYATNANGCKSDTAFKKINVRKPDPQILGSISVCPNSKGIEYNVTKSRGSSYQWTITGGTLVSGAGTSKILINWGNQGTGNVSVIETDRFGCPSDPKNLSVKKSYILDPEFPKGKTSVCEFESNVPYFVFSANGTTYQWTITGGNLIPPGNTDNVRINWGSAGTGVVISSRTAFDSVNNRQCISLPASLSVKINPTPNANVIEGDFEVCQLPDSLNYTLNGFNGSRFLWKVNGNSQNISGQGSRSIKLAWNVAGTFKIEVQELSKDSCLGQLIDTLMIVHPKPISKLLNGPFTVCDPNYMNKSYILKGLSNSTYDWTLNNGIIVSGQGTDSIVVDWSGNSPAWIKVTEISSFGCKGDSIYQDIVLDNLSLEMLVVSVGTPDDRMEINWKNSTQNLVTRTYEIEKRKTGDIVWTNIATISSFNSYIEQPLNTDDNSFDYQIKSKDLCGVQKITDTHTNVWLFGAKTEDPYAVNLEFSPYLGWKNGVKKYVLYRYVSGAGNYQPYDSFTKPEEVYYNNGLEGYLQCYRVLSYEDGGNNEKSWSNEICFNFAPTIYIPNAFTPNGDGSNDQFTIKSGAIKTFDMKIYNRWGEKVWETNNSNEFWDGNYKDKPAQMDVYMYVITLTDFRDHSFNMNGTVHLIR